MSSSNNSNSYGGPGVAGLLGVLFVGLKLTGFISWPWIWVLAPFWIPVVIAALLLLIAGILYLIANQKRY
jgi:hypothetical protein